MSKYQLEILFYNKKCVSPKVSVVLLDWSCRESLHVLHYLSRQTVPRDQYEIIWIEYYSKRADQIEEGLKDCAARGKPPIVDQWIVMGMPGNVHYHKHLMYNIGIVISRGKIVTLCDSDAIVRDTFVETIIRSFEKEPNIVLHLDEVRNNDRRFYPFNYPNIEEVRGKGCINWMDGMTTGLFDKEDPLHTLNYGACMSARREDLIKIGGADENIEYLGHICGPYEMTFRLSNTGKKEVWHQEEFLYHVWHPGIDGRGNYFGPHDGRNISVAALEARSTGRVMPLTENRAIRALRLRQENFLNEPLTSLAISGEHIKNWTAGAFGHHSRSLWKLGSFLNQPILNLRLTVTFIKITIRQLHMKVSKFSRRPISFKDILRKVPKAYDFIKNMGQYNNYVLRQCKRCLNELVSQNVRQFAVYGATDALEILYKLTLDTPLRINAIYDNNRREPLFNINVMHVEAIREYNGKIVVASLVGVEEKVERLIKLGVDRERIMLLQ